jgi:phospholipid/cholesterol/gamma-HCH transport system substrate-binding protein
MTTRRIEAIVGFVVLSAMALLIFGMLWLNRIEVGRGKKRVRVAFEDAGGLRPGDPVTVSGLEKGKVKSIELRRDKSGVLALLDLDSDVSLKRDAQFWLLDASMMGDKRIAVNSGSDPQPLDLSSIPEGLRSPGLIETTVKLGNLAQEADELLERLKRDLATPENVRSLGQAVRNITQATEQLNKMASENRTALRETARDVNQLISPNRDKLDSTIQALSRASSALDSISYKINSGQGTAGQMVNSRELYDDVRKTNKELQALITDIKANPKKYLTVKVIDF